MTVAAADREFALFKRGERRDEILSNWRIGLRQFTNPETGTTFTESEIATAVAVGSRWWIEADAIDLVLLSEQQRALWMADQVRIDRAGTSWLTTYHGPLWGESYLPATGSAGAVSALATAGTVWVGSTTVADPLAIYGNDPAGLRYQVRTTYTTPGSGVAALNLIAVDTGDETNIDSGVVITWANAPVNAQPTATATENFTGGTDAETDSDFAKRLLARIRNKPASGNASHFRTWARATSNAVEDCAVYCCAFHAGSVLAVPVQKRANATGPTARIASAATVDAVRARLVPRLSPNVPARAHVVVVPAVSQPSNVLLSLAMPKGVASGWADATPWPGYSTIPSSVLVVTDPTHFTMHSDTALPTNVTAPKLMRWDATTSRWEQLMVQVVTSGGGGMYDVTLSVAATLADGEYISPYSAKAETIAETIETYFDARGPGEVVDLATDDRAHRAFRFPEPQEELPQRVGASIIGQLSDGLGFSLVDGEVISFSVSTPTVPSDPLVGPNHITVGKVAIYSL